VYCIGLVFLSVEITAVTTREGNPVEALFGGEYIVQYHIPRRSEDVRDPGVMEVVPYS
jgi:hypothetical protein